MVKVKVWGPWACFTRPELKVERVSYPVMTPSAARGVLEAILWKPEFRWVIRRILVLREIRFQGVRRNEVQKRISAKNVAGWMRIPSSYADAAGREEGGNRTQRNTLALRDVAYLIEAEARLTPMANQLRRRPAGADEAPGPDTVEKYEVMFNRRVERGQCFHRPCLGLREFAADFGPPDGSEKPVADSRDLGRMLYDIAYLPGNRKPVFFDAARLFKDGVLIADPESAIPEPILREEVLRCSYSA